MSRLEPLADGLWSDPGEIRIGLVRLPRRMAVVRLADGALWVHSANRLDPALRAELDALGPVRWLVAPSTFHHAWLKDWRAAWPEARLWGAPGLRAKRPDLPWEGELGRDPTPESWGADLELEVLPGIPRLNEVAFLHRPGRALLLTDLCFHVGAEAPLTARLITRLTGVYGRFGVSRLFRWEVRDARALRAAAEALVERWRPALVHVAHGEPLREEVEPTLRRALAELGG